MTGVVVDVGHGATHIVPVAEGYVIGGSIKSFPIAGRDVTLFIQQLLQVIDLIFEFLKSQSLILTNFLSHLLRIMHIKVLTLFNSVSKVLHAF